MAVSAIEQYGAMELPGTAKHYWMPLVVGGAMIVALVIWMIHRRHGGDAIAAGASVA